MAYWWPDNGAITTGQQASGCFNAELMKTWGIKVHWARLYQLLLFKKGRGRGFNKDGRRNHSGADDFVLFTPAYSKRSWYMWQYRGRGVRLVALVWLRLVWAFCWMHVFESPMEQSVFSDPVHCKYDGECVRVFWSCTCCVWMAGVGCCKVTKLSEKHLQFHWLIKNICFFMCK